MSHTAQAAIALINAQADELEELRNTVTNREIQIAKLENKIDALKDDLRGVRTGIDSVSKIAMIKAIRTFCDNHGINEPGFHCMGLKMAKDMVEFMVAETKAYEDKDKVYNSPY